MDKIAFFDFDYTIINANSSNYLNKLILEKETNRTPSIADLNRFRYPDEIENLKNKLDMTIRNGQVFKYLHSLHNIDRVKMEKCLKDIKISDSMKQLFKTLQEKGFELLIVSDSNTFLIKTILKHNNLIEYFGNGERIIANKGMFDQSGCLNLVPLNKVFNLDQEEYNCLSTVCKKNICKGDIVKNYIKEKSTDCHSIYVGDGTIDFCAGSKLKSSDLFFVKKSQHYQDY